MTMDTATVPRDQITHDVRDVVRRYFELLYTCDVAQFSQVFDPAAHLYGLGEGNVVVWTADHYRQLLAGRESPKTLGSQREEALLQIDIASPTQAFAKVKVRINQMVFIDYLSLLKLKQGWRIVSKTYHRVSDG
jgi:Putative lumazine-binding